MIGMWFVFNMDWGGMEKGQKSVCHKQCVASCGQETVPFLSEEKACYDIEKLT